MIKTPCYECRDRYSGCHGTCQKYIKWCEERTAEREKKFRENIGNSLVEGYLSHKKWKR